MFGNTWKDIHFEPQKTAVYNFIDVIPIIKWNIYNAYLLHIAMPILRNAFTIFIMIWWQMLLSLASCILYNIYVIQWCRNSHLQIQNIKHDKTLTFSCRISLSLFLSISIDRSIDRFSKHSQASSHFFSLQNSISFLSCISIVIIKLKKYPYSLYFSHWISLCTFSHSVNLILALSQNFKLSFTFHLMSTLSPKLSPFSNPFQVFLNHAHSLQTLALSFYSQQTLSHLLTFSFPIL